MLAEIVYGQSPLEAVYYLVRRREVLDVSSPHSKGAHLALQHLSRSRKISWREEDSDLEVFSLEIVKLDENEIRKAGQDAMGTLGV